MVDRGNVLCVGVRGVVVLILLAGWAACSTAPSVRGQSQGLLPVDEADQDPAFFLFRAQLIEAVVRRDTQFVYSHVAPDVAIGFGGGQGLNDFKAKWQPSHPASELWSVLARVLSRGGRFQAGGEPFDSLYRFVAPYTFAAFPDDVDAYASIVITGDNVRVRAQPGTAGAIIDTVSYAVLPLRLDGDGDAPSSDEWRSVLMPSGEPGFVAAEFTASPLDYRAGFERRGGRWVMTFLVAGD